MKVEQLSVFLENQSGRLAELADTLGHAGVDILALSVADMADYGIVHLIVSNTDAAQQVLVQARFTVNRAEVVALAVPREPGGLAKMLRALEAAAVNVEYVYALNVPLPSLSAREGAFLFRFDDPEKARAVLATAGVRLIPGEEVYSS
jgi:hypothetical protein